MLTGSKFLNNRTHVARLSTKARIPNDVKRVVVRIVGNDRILTPIEHTWDSFFLSAERVSDDFMSVRAFQTQSEREEL